MTDSDTPGGDPLRGLAAGDVEAVHEASMRVLEDVGIQFNHERARAVLADHGATVGADDVVTLPRDLVAEAVGRAPAEFTLRARNPDNDVTVGGDGPPVRAPGYGPSTVHTLEDRRDARLADYERLARLTQAEDVLTCAGYNLCEPTDTPQARRHVAMLERTLRLTDKPVLGATRGAERAQDCLDMVAIAMGDPDLSEPSVAGLINTTPPRSIGREMLGGLLTYAEHGQPLVVSSFTMAGASGPATLAASLAQANAENLAAITLAQLVTPGTPVVYGVPSATIDGRYGSLSIGGPESALFVAAAGQLARYYGLPSRGGGALSDAKAVDYQSGFESTLLNAVTAFSGVDLVLNAAGVLESYSAVSPEKFVLDCEALRSLDRFGQGVTVDGGVDLDRVAAADPAGHFLDADGGLDDADGGPGDADAPPDGPGGVTGADGGPFHRSAVVDKRSYDDWAANGRESALELGHERVRTLLDGYERPPMDEGVARALDDFVADYGTDAD